MDKYTWVDLGDSYLPSEINAAYLLAQLEVAEEIIDDRMRSWEAYYEGLKELETQGVIGLPVIPDGCGHNAHMFYIKTRSLKERTDFIEQMKADGIRCAFHYVPLHSSPAGLRFGRFAGRDDFTTRESERLVRLPLYYGLKAEEVEYIIEHIYSSQSRWRDG